MAIDSFFKKLMDSPSAKGALGGAASGAVVSLLMNKKARKKLGKTAVTAGGAAAVAGLGYYAYKKWQGAKDSSSASSQPLSASSTPSPTQLAAAPTLTPTLAPVPVDPSLNVKLILSMIAAAAADGTIDPNEMDTLFASMEGSGLSAEEKGKLTAALNNPPSAEEIAALSGSPEESSELYVAALSAIDLDTPAEDFYLRRLAAGLCLDRNLVTQLHQEASSLPG